AKRAFAAVETRILLLNLISAVKAKRLKRAKEVAWRVQLISMLDWKEVETLIKILICWNDNSNMNDKIKR
ncbi:MAG: hypothetical protein M3040_05730, partial [Bacteroidota bacterium]|nr:hypothetical protein [Bacteroidota bacterium]